MFFNDYFQRRLASLLRPWLRQDPELELKLGFLRSHGVAKNLSFDPLLLNQQLFDDSSRWSFKDVTVEELSVRVSYWSFPNIIIEVHGVRVTLSLGELKEERGFRTRRILTDTALEDKENAIAEMDPEGRDLHVVMQTLADIDFTRNRNSSILGEILKCCQLHMHDIHLQVQFPAMNDTFRFVCEIKEINAESMSTENGCILKGLVSSLFSPSKEGSFSLDVKGIEIGLKKRDRMSCPIGSADLFTCVKFNGLQLMGVHLNVPVLSFSVSPEDLPIVFTCFTLSTNESNYPRNGRLLWNIAASRISYLMVTSRLTLYKLVGIICLWLRYVNAYENLLMLVGYPVDNVIERSTVKMSKDNSFSVSVKKQWKMVSEMEKKLPAEAIARGRRITRYRAALNIRQTKTHSSRLLVTRWGSFERVLAPLRLIWSFLYGALMSLMNLLWQMFLDHSHMDEQSGVSEDSCLQSCFSISIGMISLVSPVNRVQSVIGGDPISTAGSSSLGVVSFCVSIDSLFLIYRQKICEQCFLFSCGNLKVMSSSHAEDGFKNNSRYLKGHLKNKVGNSKTIIWGEPAQMFYPDDTTSNATDRSSVSPLWNLLGEMRLNWKNCCTKFEGSMIQCFENPLILCEIKGFMTDQSLKNLSSGFWKCSLMVGKLKFALDYPSILSTTRVLRQVQHALSWTDCSRRAEVVLPTPMTSEIPQAISWDSRCNSYISEMEKTMLKMLPQKHIQIAVFIAGPLIKMSLRKEGFHDENKNGSHASGQGDLHLEFDVHDVELAVWPALNSDFVASTDQQGLNDAGRESPRFQEPRTIKVPKTDNEIYMCQGKILHCIYVNVIGLEAYLHDSAENQQYRAILLNPMTIKLSCLREDVHSFSTSIVAFSAALHGLATGVTVSLCMDRLSTLVEELVDLFSAVSCVDSYGGVIFQELRRQEMSCADSASEATLVTRTKRVLSWTKVLFVISSTFELRSLDLILHSQKSNNMENSVIPFDTKWDVYNAVSKKFAMDGLPVYGILFCVQQTSLEFLCKESELEVIADLTEIRSIIFRDQSDIGITLDKFQDRNLLHSLSCLYELSLSRFTSALRLAYLQNDLPSGSGSDAAEGSSSAGKFSFAVEDSASPPQVSNIPNTVAPTFGTWLVMNFKISEIYMTGLLVKKILVGAQKSTKLECSLSVGLESRTITCHIQGGSVFIETAALAMFIECFGSYLGCIRSLLHVTSRQHMVTETGEDMAVEDGHPSERKKKTLQQMIWEQLEVFTVDLSQLSLFLVAAEESGGFKELQFDADLHLELELANTSKRFLFDLFRLSVLSQILHGNVEQQPNDIQIHHFSSLMPSNSSSQSVHEDPTLAFQLTDGIHSAFNDASCSSPRFWPKEPVVDDSVSGVLHLSRQSYILKQLSASIAVEKPVQGESRLLNEVWVGTGSITGFDMTISLLEVKMLLSTVESLSGVLAKKTSGNVKQRHKSTNQESDRSSDETIRDGALVAIQDVHQHMYMAVEGGESKCSLVGATHYSLVGDRALFRVKYQNQKRWNSSVLWFSLISLYAKSDSGEPLRLNYRPGSGFVDISSTNDGGPALWKMISRKLDSSEGDIESESYNYLARNTFYLVNKKIDRAVAFVDGVPEFVNKPGNPFKWKVFVDFPLARDVGLPDRYRVDAARTSLQHDLRGTDERFSGKQQNRPYIVIMIDKIILTIVHELPDTKETFSLLQASISARELTVQILPAKVRVISTLSMALYYFDSQSNLWRDVIHPVEICVFYRSRLLIKGSELGLHRAPVHFYSKMKEFRMSVSELSLDILLFVIGNLDLAGPYAVKTSTILANCCKVENQLGLNLLCHFYDNQDALVPRKQSSTIVLRHSALANQPPEASYVSFQLAERETYLTSPICVSIVEARSLAWRTRIMSERDSKTYPGPFIVVDISSKNEDGFSISVSPLLRIHNETKFSMELCFRRPEQNEAQSASVVLKTGDTVDDSLAAFDAINLSGGLKKALTSLSVGNFLLSFRPEITEYLANAKKLLSVEWSDDVKGGKAVRLSGIFDKLSYKIRKAFLVEPARYSFSTVCCSLRYEDGEVADLFFLVQSVVRNIPVLQPNNHGYAPGNWDSPVALKEQKEIFLLPTVRVFNMLQEEIHVLLTDMDPCAAMGRGNIGNQATIPRGSSADFFVNPVTIYFIVTLTAFNSSCKPVNSGDWVKKLQKGKDDVRYLDTNIDFCDGKYLASLRLSRGHKGVLEVAIFTLYTLENDTDIPFFCCAPYQKPLSRDEAEKLGFMIPPELGTFLPPKSTKSWFMKKNKVCLRLLEEKVSVVILDLDALSGLTEISLEVEDASGFKYLSKLGVSLGPLTSELNVPSQLVSIVPRYIVSNESEEAIIVRQCYLEDDMEGMIPINSKQKIALKLRSRPSKRETRGFEKFVRKHRNTHDDSLAFIQFRPDKAGLGWSGPVCVASLGRFFLKFKRPSDFLGEESSQVTAHGNISAEFAAVHVVERSSTLVLHFHKPPDVNLPYRIENSLHQAFITYYQKDSVEPENLGSGKSVDYVWDDSTLPRRLVVQVNGMNLLREINLDKVRAWKPFYRVSQRRGLGFHLPLDKKPGEREKPSFGESMGFQVVNVGYEVYADGPTRVLRFCEVRDSHNQDVEFHSNTKIRLRVSSFALHLVEHRNQERDNDASSCGAIVVLRLENVNLDSMLTDKHKYNEFRVQLLSVDQKWVGAPYAAMLRRHQSGYSYTNDDILRVVVVLLPSSSNVKQVKYSSVVLQPLDLNLDEETLMRLVPFWRTSLSESNARSQQYYFDHFEIHPIKIIASFLPGDSYSSYSSSQEMLRSLLHSVIKVPVIKSATVELNGVLVTHALINIRELFIKCAQHYSWYAMRAIYIAKGSSLLPPAFASIFDDLASSSLDAFFDPSSGQIHLPGLTIGTFKLISKCIDGKGFSGTKRYLGDLGKTVKMAGSNVLFAAVTEISDSVLKGAEANGLNGVISGFHHGILKLAMEPSVLGAAFVEGGPDRKIELDRSPGIDELYIEGYLQAMLDTVYKQEYLRVRVIDNQVFLKNLPPNSSLIEEIIDRVKGFLVSKALLKGDSSITSQPLRHRRGDSEWKIGPTVLTLCEHLLVSFAIRILRKQSGKLIAGMKLKEKSMGDDQKAIIPAPAKQGQKMKLFWKWGIGKFVVSCIFAYIDGRLCRSIPHPVARRIVSGFLLSFIDKNEDE